MNVFLQELSEEYKGDETMLVCDGAGWHKSKALALPENLHLVFMPLFRRETNPFEQIWREIRTRGFRNEIFRAFDDVMTSLCETVVALTHSTVRSITARDWILSLF